jgi:antitoxin component YwqK of YwqJK toxin-antitoxin module
MKNKNIKPRNENNQPHGYFEYYYDNGELYYKGNYVNGIRHGYWEGYNYNGELENKTYHI